MAGIGHCGFVTPKISDYFVIFRLIAFISAWILLVLELLTMDINWSAEFVPIEDEDLANFMEKLETENIPEVFVPAVVNSQQAPVARDASVSEADVMTFIEGKKKKNTVSSTSRDVNNIRRWLAENKWELRDLEDIPVDELNRYLAQMWISIRKKKGGEYEPSSLDQMKNSLDRYLREKTSGSVTLRSTTFDLSSRSLTAKKQQLKQEGLGRRAHKSLAITEEEELLLWERKQLGITLPTALQFTVFYALTKGMGFRGREQHHKLRFSDIQLGNNSDGLRYIEYHERDSKTMDGTGKADWRPTVPRIYSDGTDKDPVVAFETYVERRPKSMCQENSPFYLTPIPTKRLRADDLVWYYPTPMGHNTLGSLLKNACEAAGIQGKKTNHSLRKTTVKALQKAGVAAHKICQMTGHKNPASLKSYDDELEESEQISYSKILSNRTNSNTQIAPPMAPPVTPVMSYQQAQVQKIPAQATITSATSTVTSASAEPGHFPPMVLTNCTNCTFNFQVQTYPTAPKRRRAVIESDSSQSQ